MHPDNEILNYTVFPQQKIYYFFSYQPRELDMGNESQSVLFLSPLSFLEPRIKPPCQISLAAIKLVAFSGFTRYL